MCPTTSSVIRQCLPRRVCCRKVSCRSASKRVRKRRLVTIVVRGRQTCSCKCDCSARDAEAQEFRRAKYECARKAPQSKPNNWCKQVRIPNVLLSVVALTQFQTHFLSVTQYFTSVCASCTIHCSRIYRSRWVTVLFVDSRSVLPLLPETPAFDLTNFSLHAQVRALNVDHQCDLPHVTLLAHI